MCHALPPQVVVVKREGEALGYGTSRISSLPSSARVFACDVPHRPGVQSPRPLVSDARRG